MGVEYGVTNHAAERWWQRFGKGGPRPEKWQLKEEVASAARWSRLATPEECAQIAATIRYKSHESTKRAEYRIAGDVVFVVGQGIHGDRVIITIYRAPFLRIKSVPTATKRELYVAR